MFAFGVVGRGRLSGGMPVGNGGGAGGRPLEGGTSGNVGEVNVLFWALGAGGGVG